MFSTRSQEVLETKLQLAIQCVQLQGADSSGGMSAEMPLSMFWADYAQYLLSRGNNAGPVPLFESCHLHTAATCFTAAVFALAILAPTLQVSLSMDVGNASTSHSHENHGTSMLLTLRKPAFVFVQETQALMQSEPLPSRLSLSGKLFLVDPAVVAMHDVIRPDPEPINGPILCGKVYSLHIIISNGSSVQQTFEVVAPAPPLAVPLKGALPVNVIACVCAPYACIMHEVHFYFPETGMCSMPKVTLVSGGDAVAALQADTPAVEVHPRLAGQSDLCPSWECGQKYVGIWAWRWHMASFNLLVVCVVPCTGIKSSLSVRCTSDMSELRLLQFCRILCTLAKCLLAS
jgi:hypothetical protein